MDLGARGNDALDFKNNRLDRGLKMKIDVVFQNVGFPVQKFWCLVK